MILGPRWLKLGRYIGLTLSLNKKPESVQRLSEANAGPYLHVHRQGTSQDSGRIVARITNYHSPALEKAIYTHMIPWQVGGGFLKNIGGNLKDEKCAPSSTPLISSAAGARAARTGPR